MPVLKYKDGEVWKEAPNAVAYQKVVLDGINFSKPVFGYNNWNDKIEKNIFETKNLTTDASSSGLGGNPVSGAFHQCTELTEIPFSLNFKSNEGIDLQNCFSNCYELKYLPNIQCDKIINLNYTFSSCLLITEIPQCYYTPVYLIRMYNGLFEYCCSVCFQVPAFIQHILVSFPFLHLLQILLCHPEERIEPEDRTEYRHEKSLV